MMGWPILVPAGFDGSAEAGPTYLIDAKTETQVAAWSYILAFQIRLQPIFQNNESSFFVRRLSVNKGGSS